jgi:transcriptional regulator NrdR family protein
MKKVTLTIKAQGAVINDFVSIYEGAMLSKAVGNAISGAHENCTKQYVDPVIFIDDIQLTKSMVNLITGNYWTLQESFKKIVESILPIYAMKSESDRVEYIRYADVNNYFKSQKSFTPEELASVVKEQQKKAQFTVTINKAMAKSAVWTKDQLALKAKFDTANKELRLANKEAKQLNSSK